ncbi:heavy-metal-associated domain-containing protein [Flavihumibacter stibioxidans]|uniref:Heavy metal transport/detoxification protein n=1 Tax=Flavihumibacter stibioxidans TaxID=1834163 RepID=A0ABR7MCP3_9BACT|nr:heavy-metal-associated domain-containing protein [Flavihumibacter stibioxidans]MBC6492800.1 heavy metal transport/detoxification protein [Flavihumibacter stibioxidans]
MEILKFKTNIKCSGCVSKATPFLNDTAGAENWEVDTNVPEKLLTITSTENITPELIIKAVQEAGYKAEQVN